MPENEIKETNQIVITKQIEIDKNDIANIAIAEAELKIKRMIQEMKKQLDENEAKTREKMEELATIGRNLTNAAGHKKATNFIKIFSNLPRLGKKTEYKFTVEIETGFVTTINHILDETSEVQNNYTVYLKFENSRTDLKSTMQVEEGPIAIFPQQVKCAKEIQKLEQEHDRLYEDSIMWRRRLSDIPAIERQIRAKLARRQISQTQEGKEMVEELIKSIDGDIKLLGI